MNLFGRKKNEPKPDINSTIQTLRETQNLLDKRENHLSKECGNYREEARKFAREKNKAKALYFLKKMKMVEKQLEKIFNQKYNLEIQISMLCEASINKETVNAMKVARDAMKLNEKDINIDSIADVMDDVTESIDNIEEVSSILSAPIGNITNDEDLLQELNDMEEELVLEDQNMREPALALPVLPSVPKKDVPSSHRDTSGQRPFGLTEEEELQELEKMML